MLGNVKNSTQTVRKKKLQRKHCKRERTHPVYLTENIETVAISVRSSVHNN